jgi:hypothetical protein
MKTRKRVLAAAAALILGIVFLTDGLRADEKDDRAKAARVAMDKLVPTAAKKSDDLKKEAAKYVSDAKISSEDSESFKPVMDLLGKRDTSDPKNVAWGVGKAPGAIKPDDIDLKLKALVKDKPKMTPKQLAAEQEALVELANRTAAVGAVALAAAPKKKLPDKDPKDWKEYAEDMIKAAQELARVAGAKDTDPAKVIKAAANLNSTCSNCHGKFRE